MKAQHLALCGSLQKADGHPPKRLYGLAFSRHLWPDITQPDISYCLPVTLLTSKSLSPLCLRRNGGTAAASLRCVVVVNYNRRLGHLPSYRSRGCGVVVAVVLVWGCGGQTGILLLHSTLPCSLPPHNVSLETEAHYAPATRPHLLRTVPAQR